MPVGVYCPTCLYIATHEQHPIDKLNQAFSYVFLWFFFEINHANDYQSRLVLDISVITKMKCYVDF